MSPLALYSRLVCGVYRWIWLGKVDSSPPPLARGSVIFAAHYNGAIDGFTYGSQMPPFLAVVSTQWHRNAFLRLLVPGLSVQRAKDGMSGARNLATFRGIMSRLRQGDRVLFFPEGTSRLGLERLPVQAGTLLLLRQLRREAAPPAIYFTAARYHQPTAWRSAVSIAWVGPVEPPESPEGDAEWVRSLLLGAQTASHAMTVPSASKVGWLAALLALPFLPAWYLTFALARRKADDDNVIALWKFIFGVPLTALTLCGLVALFAALGWPWCLPIVSLAGGWLLWRK
jgi:hypothetical protein